MTIVYDLPRPMAKGTRLYIIHRTSGDVWNRFRRQFEPSFVEGSNRPYKTLGHARRGAAIANRARPGALITITNKIPE